MKSYNLSDAILSISSKIKLILSKEYLLFFNFLMIFIWLSYELYKSFNSEPDFRWEFSFTIIGIPFALIFVGLFLYVITRALINEIRS